MLELKVYQMAHDGETWLVVASNYRDAVNIWKHKMAKENEVEESEQEGPEASKCLGEMFAMEDPS